MASDIRIVSTAPSRVRGGKDDRSERRPQADPQVRLRYAELSDAELQQVTAAGGIRVESDGANN